ncbi:hypothetical protein FO440_15270 [Mucilaginibacter corticis]|uniref:Uncharacterized protein n=1 Tax=Mucilaginibacter corticis TaxID=2597670 RepID=A0A556MMC0_9SPHI|nr:hypothetical protein [Mucilaginibacter corticis]TSJ41087.1 hypothetical protein FO440_15270 [Mucilaginibacter corticis]
MKKRNNYVNETLSFEDFEQAIAQRHTSDVALDELVRERLTAKKEAQKKERDLKRARNKF